MQLLFHIVTNFCSEQEEFLLQKQLYPKPTLQLMRFAWRPETMVLPGHKVAITVARLLTDSKAITKAKDSHYL